MFQKLFGVDSQSKLVEAAFEDVTTMFQQAAKMLDLDYPGGPEIARCYAEVNQLFGDIVKVTPSSKVVGDRIWWPA